jgi:hypothetical protein
MVGQMPAAFLSYARFNDQQDDNRITYLREAGRRNANSQRRSV